LLKIAGKLKKVLSVFRSTNEELRIEEIQARLKEKGMEVPKTTLRTWLNVLNELGLIKIDFSIERGRGARVVAKYRPRILPGDIIVGIPKDEINQLRNMSGMDVLSYLLKRSGYISPSTIHRDLDKMGEKLEELLKKIEEI